MKINYLTASNIKLTRKQLGLSAEYVAYKLQLSKGAYSLIENGKTEITLSRLEAIAKVFDVKPFSLLPIEKIRPSINYFSEINELSSLLKSITDKITLINEVEEN